MKTTRVSLLLAALVLSSINGRASIVATDLGTAAPPAILGGYGISMFGLDPRPTETYVSGVNGVTFSHDLELRKVPETWATWSHGYEGSVYFDDSGTGVTLGMPSNTRAFLFYAEPDPFDLVTITATANDGTFLSIVVNGDSGANGFGFHTTGATTISSISVNSDELYAIGELGIHVPVPEPSTYAAGALLLLPFGASMLRNWRQRRQSR